MNELSLAKSFLALFPNKASSLKEIPGQMKFLHNTKIKKDYVILILLCLAITAAAGFLYLFFQERAPSAQNQTTTPGQSLSQEQLPQSENENPSSLPILIKSEVSRGNTAKKQIIFTFDGGASNVSADKILDVAQKYNLKLSFFVTGKFAQKYPETTKEIAQAGHEIFNHTYSHPYLTKISDDEIKKELSECADIVFNLTSQTTKPFFRPPYGSRNEHVLAVAAQEGYRSVFWTIDALDWMPEKTADEVKKRIFSNLTNGAIILMHVGDSITGEILEEVFEGVINQGYEIVSLTEGLK